MPTRDYDCAGEVIRVDQRFVDESKPRVHLSAFEVTGSAVPVLTIERVEGLPDTATVAEGPLGRCVFELEGNHFRAEVPDGMFPAELVLRLAWYIVSTRSGGVLLHAAAISNGRSALVASGKSGDGKSTLSRLSRSRGLALLTDEIVQVFPDGSCAGTPFRSDEDNVGRPGRLPVKHFVALEKAQAESLNALSPVEAMLLASSQCFDGSVLALPKPETNRRLLSFLGNAPLGRLAFRKNEAVGDFVRGLLDASP